LSPQFFRFVCCGRLSYYHPFMGTSPSFLDETGKNSNPTISGFWPPAQSRFFRRRVSIQTPPDNIMSLFANLSLFRVLLSDLVFRPHKTRTPAFLLKYLALYLFSTLFLFVIFLFKMVRLDRRDPMSFVLVEIPFYILPPPFPLVAANFSLAGVFFLCVSPQRQPGLGNFFPRPFATIGVWKCSTVFRPVRPSVCV